MKLLRLCGTDKKAFFDGMRNGVPIGLGYLAVSFSLGITAKKAGLSAVQAFIASLLCNASAGEYAAFSLIAANAAYIEVALMTLIANARYLLMSFAMSQRLAPGTKMRHRLLMGWDITDELFAIAIARDGFLNPYYTYGATLTTVPMWAFGTAMGVAAGNIMPARLVSALGVALYGMFLAVIIPPCKKDKIIAALIVVCFAASYAADTVPVISAIPSGTRTVILTVVISAAAALLFPKKQTEEIKQ